MKGQIRQASTPREYLAALSEPRKADVAALHRLIRRTAPNLKPFIHLGVLAYGPIHYRYASGREGDACKIGVASNARYISLYTCAADGTSHVAERYKSRLPRASVGKGCVRFRKLADLDVDVLASLIREVERTGYGV
jgi:Domain of unknown function (DU1801)